MLTKFFYSFTELSFSIHLSRKDFSIRFPDAVERTANNIIQFVLEHGSERTRQAIYGDDDDVCCKAGHVRKKIEELESRLQTAEEERAFLEASLKEAMKAKAVAEERMSEAVKEVRNPGHDDAKEEQLLRVAAEYLGEKLEERLKQAEETSFKAASALFSKALELTKDKLQAKEGQVSQLLLEKSDWSQGMRENDLALERAERASSDLRKHVRALVRRLRRLEFASRLSRVQIAESRRWKHEFQRRARLYQEHNEKMSKELEEAKSSLDSLRRFIANLGDQFQEKRVRRQGRDKTREATASGHDFSEILDDSQESHPRK